MTVTDGTKTVSKSGENSINRKVDQKDGSSGWGGDVVILMEIFHL